MNDTIFELKIKGFCIKADKEYISLSKENNEIIKVSYVQVKAIAKWSIEKIKEITNNTEKNKLEK